MERGTRNTDHGLGADRGYLSKLAKLLFIADNLEDEEAARREFELEGLNLNYLGGIRYLGAYLGPREELDA